MREMKDSGIEWVGKIPTDWDIKPVKRFFKAVKRVAGVNADTYERLALTMNGVIKRSKEDNEGLQPEKFEGYQVLKTNELVFKLIDLENVKTSRVGLSPYIGIVSPAYIILTNDNKDNRFYYYWFIYMYYHEIFNSLGDSGVRSSLGAKELLMLPIPDISIETQKRISDYLDEKCSRIDEIIEKQQKIIEKLKEYKLSVITEAVTKGLDPNVPMKDSGVEWIGEIPESWKIIDFKYICSIKANLVNVDKYKDYPQISPENIAKDSGKIIGYNTVEESGVISDNHLFYKGQLLYSKVRPKLNKVAIAPFDGLCSADMYPMETSEFPNFILYVILSQYFLNQVVLQTEDRVKMPKINKEELGRIIVAIPDVDEQILIADYLNKKCDAIDNAIDRKQIIVEKLKEYKKSLVYEVVTGKKEV